MSAPVTLYREIDALGGAAMSSSAYDQAHHAGYSEALDLVLAILTKRGFSEAADAPDWQPMETAPQDGALFDALREGIRYTDCYIKNGRVSREHSYPMATTRFLTPCEGWLPRPDALIMPYETNKRGQKYVPGFVK